MNKLVTTDTVDTQYKNQDKLNIGIRLHQLSLTTWLWYRYYLEGTYAFTSGL